MIKKMNLYNKWIAIALLMIIILSAYHLVGLNNSIEKEYRSSAFEIMVTFNETVYRLEQFIENPESDMESLILVYESYGGLVETVERWQEFIDEVKLEEQTRMNVKSKSQQIFDLKELLNDSIEYRNNSIEIKDIDRIEEMLQEIKESQQIFKFERIMTLKDLKKSFAEN